MRATAPWDAGLLAELAGLSAELAWEAGEFLVGQRPAQLAVTTKSSHTDPVTVMDSRSEQLLRARLRAARPQDAVLGEEGGTEAGSSGLTWVLDPLDGTVNYLYGLPAFAVSVAVVAGDPAAPGRWSPLAGAVCHPSVGEVFHASLGGGAWRRRGGPHAGAAERLRVRPSGPLATSLIATGFGYAAPERAAQARVLVEVLPQVRDIRRAGSAALDLCAVAAGTLDGYYEEGVNAWDVAAGWLLVAEAGGLVTGWHGRPPVDPAVVAGPLGVHAALLAALEAVVPAPASTAGPPM